MASQKFTGGEGRRQWKKCWEQVGKMRHPRILTPRGTMLRRTSLRYVAHLHAHADALGSFSEASLNDVPAGRPRRQVKAARCRTGAEKKKGTFNYLSTGGDWTVKGRRLHLAL